jgi:hypothetical protein
MEYNTYLSDEDIDIENNENVELDQYGMYVEEIDDEEELEIRRIVSNSMLLKINSNDDFLREGLKTPNKKSFKESKISKKKSMSLNDLNNFIDKKIEDSKPKKFISKRLMDRKISEPSLVTKNEKIQKRHFNPKLIPYLFSEEYKNKKFNNDLEIPNFNNLNFPNL